MKITPNFKIQLTAFVITLLSFSNVQAQKFKYSIPGLDTLQQNFVIGGTSTGLLSQGQFEYVVNNQLTSFWIAFHQGGEASPILDRFRRTQFDMNIIGYFGISGSGRFDLGLQARHSSSRIDNAATSSMFKVFNSTKTDSEIDPFFSPNQIFDNSYHGLTYIGLRFRLKPILEHPEFLINGGYLRSTIKDANEQVQLAADRDIFDIGATYYKSINNNIYYFTGVSMQAFLKNKLRDEYLFNNNFSFFLIHRTANKKFTFYPGLSYSISYKPSKFDERNLIKTSDFLFALAGIQYAPIQAFNIFLTGGFPLTLKVTHPNQKIVRESYSTVALGFRGSF